MKDRLIKPAVSIAMALPFIAFGVLAPSNFSRNEANRISTKEKPRAPPSPKIAASNKL